MRRSRGVLILNPLLGSGSFLTGYLLDGFLVGCVTALMFLGGLGYGFWLGLSERDHA